MIKLRAVPIALAVAGLFTSSLALAQNYTYTQNGGYPDGPTTDGRPNYSQMLNPVLTKSNDIKSERGRVSVAMRRADAAWARGDKKQACRWAGDAQSGLTVDIDVRNAVDEYCAGDNRHDTHDAHSG